MHWQSDVFICDSSFKCGSQEIPSLEFPLHTLIELTPKPDGKMSEHHVRFDVINKRHLEVITQASNSCPLIKDQKEIHPFARPYLYSEQTARHAESLGELWLASSWKPDKHVKMCSSKVMVINLS